MSHPEGYSPGDQHNYGSGTFIGRDLRIETLSPGTKAVLEKLGKDAPELAAILRKALKEGVISPDAVVALQVAAQNINHDVANALWHAGSNINPDVAHILNYAAQNINEGVARRIATASSNIDEGARRLEGAANTLNSANLSEWEGIATAIEDAAQNMAYAAQAYRDGRRGVYWKSFWAGAGVCLGAIILILGLWTYILQK